MRIKCGGVILLSGLIPLQAARADIPLVKTVFDDGLYLYSSPLRLEASDVPAGLAAAGLLGGAVATDRITRNNLLPYSNDVSANTLKRYGDVAQFAGPILSGVYAVYGWSAHDASSSLMALDLIESFGWAAAISETFKLTLGRRRPDATDDPFELRPGNTSGSFPSGHTITAFAAATTVAEEYPRWEIEVPAYAAAGAVAFSRIYANQHWGSDVVGGALLGYGVSHTLRKRHHRLGSAWTFGIDAGGFRVTKTF